MLARKAPSGPTITLNSFPANDAAPNTGAAKTIDWSQGPVQRFTLDQSCTITAAGLPAGESVPDLYVELTQGAGGSKLVLFLGAKTPGGNGTNLSTAAGAKDIVQLVWDGFVLYAKVFGLDWGP